MDIGQMSAHARPTHPAPIDIPEGAKRAAASGAASLDGIIGFATRVTRGRVEALTG